MITIPFSEWLNACAQVAMEDEWCIDTSWPRWRELYDADMTARQAIDELFREVRLEDECFDKAKRPPR